MQMISTIRRMWCTPCDSFSLRMGITKFIVAILAQLEMAIVYTESWGYILYTFETIRRIIPALV